MVLVLRLVVRMRMGRRVLLPPNARHLRKMFIALSPAARSLLLARQLARCARSQASQTQIPCNVSSEVGRPCLRILPNAA
jgi:hypothetical protein